MSMTNESLHRRTIARVISLLVLLVLSSGPRPIASDGFDLLTNEDIVRMSARGMSPAEIIEAIRKARATAFDLEPDILLELGRAGVQPQVIEAMRVAQPVTKDVEPATATGRLLIEFEGFDVNGSDGDGPTEDIDPADRTAVFLAADRGGVATQMAFFVTCMDPTHVPDLWMNATPLSEFPRHALLWFHDEVRPYERPSRHPLVYLDLPASVPIGIETGLHELQLGVAARLGDEPWSPLGVAEVRARLWEDRDTRVVVKVSTRRFFSAKRLPRGVPLHDVDIVTVEPAPEPVVSDPSQDGS